MELLICAKKKKDVILQLLKDKRYAILETDEEYQYLVKMPMDSVSEENIERLYKERDSKQEILDNTKKQTVYQMWLLDLESLEKVYLKYKQERNKDSNSNSNGEKKKSAKKIVG